jgi:hypothetical protein
MTIATEVSKTCTKLDSYLNKCKPEMLEIDNFGSKSTAKRWGIFKNDIEKVIDNIKRGHSVFAATSDNEKKYDEFLGECYMAFIQLHQAVFKFFDKSYDIDNLDNNLHYMREDSRYDSAISTEFNVSKCKKYEEILDVIKKQKTISEFDNDDMKNLEVAHKISWEYFQYNGCAYK